MEKKKRIVSKLIFALVIAVIVSMCFVGTTLARYASGSNGSASTGVALWDIDFETSATDSTTVNAKFDKLSPDDTEYKEASEATANRKHETAKVLVAKITNNGDVDADVKITIGDTIAYTATASGEVTFAPVGSDWNDQSNVQSDTKPTKANVDKLFSLALYYGGNNALGAEATAASTPITSGTTVISVPAASDGTPSVLNIYGVVTWTSDDDTLKGNSDKLDTLVGQNIATVSFDLTIDAVQGSEAPATT